MARYTYFFSNGTYNDWHRKYDGIAMIDVDSIEVCAFCYEPLAILETCYDKDQLFKATTLVKTLAVRLKIPSFLVFYKEVGKGSLNFRIKRLWLPNAKYELMNEDEWVNVLYGLHNEHKVSCTHQ